MTIHYALFPNHLTDDPAEYAAMVQTHDSADLDDVADRIVEGGSVVGRAEILAVLERCIQPSSRLCWKAVVSALAGCAKSSHGFVECSLALAMRSIRPATALMLVPILAAAYETASAKTRLLRKTRPCFPHPIRLSCGTLAVALSTTRLSATRARVLTTTRPVGVQALA